LIAGIEKEQLKMPMIPVIVAKLASIEIGFSNSAVSLLESIS
jgi:hypothetical protein